MTKENPDFLTSQILTYIGNKRILIKEIEPIVQRIKEELGRNKIVCADIFSGSGIVARMLKSHCKTLIVNDLENYSAVINSCYLTNQKDFDRDLYLKLKSQIEKKFAKEQIAGIITKDYAPADEDHIKKEDRVFYTKENALAIDTYRSLIDSIVPADYQKFFLAPLIIEASIHTNTSGVFKGFYKDKRTGIGSYGGMGQNALSRIKGKIELREPVLSNFNCNVEIFQKDAVELSRELKDLDVVYLDPPYNQHPYGSNYFMLNLILKNEITAPVSRVSGIVSDWNRSAFNKKKKALDSLEVIINNLDSKYIIVSYNSEGFIDFEQMTSMLEKYGKLERIEIPYNTFRGSRNLAERSIYVSEYLFILRKN